MNLKHKLKTLERRKAFLELQVAKNPENTSHTFDKAEISALGLAIECVKLCVGCGLLVRDAFEEDVLRWKTKATRSERRKMKEALELERNPS